MDLADELHANIASSYDEHDNDKKASAIDTFLADNLFTSINAVAREVRQLKEATNKPSDASKQGKKSAARLALHARGDTDSSSADSGDVDSSDSEQAWCAVPKTRLVSSTDSPVGNSRRVVACQPWFRAPLHRWG